MFYLFCLDQAGNGLCLLDPGQPAGLRESAKRCPATLGTVGSRLLGHWGTHFPLKSTGPSEDINMELKCTGAHDVSQGTNPQI